MMKKIDDNTRLKRFCACCILSAAAVAASPSPALAYIGPGAGFALATSFFALFVTIAVVLGVLALLPFRLLRRALTKGRRATAARTGDFDRIVILGLDGLDPRIARTLIEEGRMPEFAALEREGHFSPLATTCPSVSPVAWSTFATGVNPGRHNIFDFLTPDRVRYIPKLSSSEISGARRKINIGKFSIPLGRADMRLLRKGKAFWDIATDHGIPSVSMRVPITFPPVKSKALLLSGMCAPDLRGSQGSYSFFTSDTAAAAKPFVGERRALTPCGKDGFSGTLNGPDNPFRTDSAKLKIDFKIKISGDGATLRLGGHEPVKLKTGEYSEWIQLRFRALPGIAVSGIARFLLTGVSPHIKLYVSPINIDPAKPALPVSNPGMFSVWLAKLLGRYATLGLAEDTWALNEGDISHEQFLKQVWLNHAEREKMLRLALDRFRRGLVVCVFDTPDRIQHMFHREYSRAAAAGDESDPLRDMYVRMDALLVDVRKRLGPKDILFVISDHGIAPFDRCFNINTWLLRNGYLALKDGAATEGDYFSNVDWSRTRAFSVGMAGIFINTKGKYPHGVVEQGSETESLKKEISEKLRAATDPGRDRAPVRDVIDSAQLYNGPFTENSPDLVVCFDSGYRASWESVTGGLSADIVSDNTRAWTGDHCVDPRLVPGVLFSNRKVTLENPHIRDLSATALKLFGIPRPDNMQGRPLF